MASQMRPSEGQTAGYGLDYQQSYAQHKVAAMGPPHSHRRDSAPNGYHLIQPRMSDRAQQENYLEPRRRNTAGDHELQQAQAVLGRAYPPTKHHYADDRNGAYSTDIPHYDERTTAATTTAAAMPYEQAAATAPASASQAHYGRSHSASAGTGSTSGAGGSERTGRTTGPHSGRLQAVNEMMPSRSGISSSNQAGEALISSATAGKTAQPATGGMQNVISIFVQDKVRSTPRPVTSPAVLGVSEAGQPPQRDVVETGQVTATGTGANYPYAGHGAPLSGHHASSHMPGSSAGYGFDRRDSRSAAWDSQPHHQHQHQQQQAGDAGRSNYSGHVSSRQYSGHQQAEPAQQNTSRQHSSEQRSGRASAQQAAAPSRQASTPDQQLQARHPSSGLVQRVSPSSDYNPGQNNHGHVQQQQQQQQQQQAPTQYQPYPPQSHPTGHYTAAAPAAAGQVETQRGLPPARYDLESTENAAPGRQQEPSPRKGSGNAAATAASTYVASRGNPTSAMVDPRYSHANQTAANVGYDHQVNNVSGHITRTPSGPQQYTTLQEHPIPPSAPGQYGPGQATAGYGPPPGQLPPPEQRQRQPQPQYVSVPGQGQERNHSQPQQLPTSRPEDLQAVGRGVPSQRSSQPHHPHAEQPLPTNGTPEPTSTRHEYEPTRAVSGRQPNPATRRVVEDGASRSRANALVDDQAFEVGDRHPQVHGVVRTTNQTGDRHTSGEFQQPQPQPQPQSQQSRPFRSKSGAGGTVRPSESRTERLGSTGASSSVRRGHAQPEQRSHTAPVPAKHRAASSGETPSRTGHPAMRRLCTYPPEVPDELRQLNSNLTAQMILFMAPSEHDQCELQLAELLAQSFQSPNKPPGN
ncbi:uncharacterized protein LOC135814140 isoform X2 [Sycon ciliatum]|uniref:uncharacterized protein LOC135814140 isoform X2 n=1 Tax=Sycon ciliatum TaxID=27933 RepID=UPI0031F6D9B2